jgi:hypothetical protein
MVFVGTLPRCTRSSNQSCNLNQARGTRWISSATKGCYARTERFPDAYSWQNRFQKVIQRAVPEGIVAAEAEIRFRLHALIGTPYHQERRAIENALDVLRLLRRKMTLDS